MGLLEGNVVEFSKQKQTETNMIAAVHYVKVATVNLDFLKCSDLSKCSINSKR